jgi:gamma-glutamyltranspeptidase/glutathione hydrolase
VWDPKGKQLYGLNASGRSPASLTLEHFQKEKITRLPRTGPLPVSVPGCVDGWCELSGRFGKLPLAPGARAGRALRAEGAPVSELVAYYWGASVPRSRSTPASRSR